MEDEDFGITDRTVNSPSEPIEKGFERAADATVKHIRGSSLLLIGRLVTLLLNFGIQVFSVRYLTKGDYGAFSYALSFVAIVGVIALFGLDKAIDRFVPIYHEQKDYPRMFGTILLTLFTILGIGVVIVAVVLSLQNVTLRYFTSDPLSISLLLITIVIAPINALESYFQDMLAVFASARAIFFRRYLLGPALRLVAVLIVIVIKGSVALLAVGYVIGSLLGIVVYVVMMLNVLQSRGILQHFNARQIIFPVREVYGFSIPLLTSDLLQSLKTQAVILLLGYFRTNVDVAEYRAVFSVAGFNLIVMQSFRLLYTPLAARLVARKDREGINDLYWKTATWITLISFPVFVVTFSLAEQISVLLYGSRYAHTGVLLSLLSFGNYFNAALGFNSYTLRVYGRVRYIVFIDIVTSITNLLINLLLIPRYGALGAAIGTCITLVLYNLLNQTGLLLGTGINLFQKRYLMVYVSIILAAGGLLIFTSAFRPHIVVSIALAGLVSVALLRINRASLDVEKIFPELLRIPLLRPLLGV